MNAIAELKRTSNMMRWCLTIAVLLLFYFSFLFVSIWFVFESDRNKHSTAFVHKISFTLTKKKIRKIRHPKDSLMILSWIFSHCARSCCSKQRHALLSTSSFFIYFLRNFSGLFNERRDLIYWFPLNTHWEYREISCEFVNVFFFLHRVFAK